MDMDQDPADREWEGLTAPEWAVPEWAVPEWVAPV